MKIEAWKRRARQLSAQTYALYLAYRHPRTPWYAKVFVALIVGYVFSPKAACINVGPDAPCDHERLFRRPAQEDRRGQRTRDAHHRGRSRLWRGPLFGQALRKDGPRRGIAAPQEQSGQTPEGGREREETPGG